MGAHGVRRTVQTHRNSATFPGGGLLLSLCLATAATGWWLPGYCTASQQRWRLGFGGRGIAALPGPGLPDVAWAAGIDLELLLVPDHQRFEALGVRAVAALPACVRDSEAGHGRVSREGWEGRRRAIGGQWLHIGMRPRTPLRSTRPFCEVLVLGNRPREKHLPHSLSAEHANRA